MSSQIQVKITLPKELREFIESKANKFGLPVSAYIRYLVLRDVENMEYPEYEASQKTEKEYVKAKAERKKGETLEVADLDKFLDEL